MTIGAVVFGLVIGGVAVIGWWAARAGTPDAPRSVRLEQLATAVGAGGFGLMVIAIGVFDGQSAVIVAIAYLMFGVVLLYVAGLVLRGVERRRDRRLRRELGLPTLRRRLHPGWAAAAGLVLSVLILFGTVFAATYVLVPAGVGTYPQLEAAVRSPAAQVLPPVMVLGLPTLAAVVQAWRRRVRDREIENADQAAVDLAPSPHRYRPPTWMPVRMGEHWKSIREALDKPVEPGKENLTIATALGLNTMILLITSSMGWTFWTSAQEPFERVLMTAATMVAAVITFSFFAPHSVSGLRTAVRQLRTRPPKGEEPPPSAGVEAGAVG